MIPINPEAIGDPNQTPVVYIGEEAGKALGIPQRDPSLPSPTQHPGQEVDEVRRRIENAQHLVGALASGEQRWKMTIPADRERDSDLILAAALDDAERLLADLDAAREALRRVEQERDELLASLTELAPSSLGAELAELRALYQTVKANWEHQREFLEWLIRLDEPGNEERRRITLAEIIKRASAAVDTYETQEGTDAG